MNLNNTISLSPNQFASNIYKKVSDSVKEKYTRKILGSKDIYIIGIVSVNKNSIKNGEIDDITASVLYSVEYSVIAFKPVKNEVIDVDVLYLNELGVWGVIHDLNEESIEVFCPRTYISKAYNEEEISFGPVKKDCVIKVKIINFKINTNKIEILGSIA